MGNKLFIGCDIGTSSTKAVACNLQGEVLAESTYSYGIIQKRNNWAEQDPSVWVDAMIATIRSVIKKVDETLVEGICISALYGGTGVMCDEDMNSIRPAIIWMDRRAEKESQWIRDNIGEDKIFEVSGNGIDSYFGYTKLLWVKTNEPHNWKKIKYILPIHSYIVYKLTGEIGTDFCSAGNVGGIYDYTKHCWSEEMCKKLDIPYDALPSQLHSPEHIIGNIKSEYRDLLGLMHETKICVGTVDCIASMLSAGIKSAGDNAVVLGTSLNWGLIQQQKPSDPNLISMPFCINPLEMSYTYGGASTAGALPRWFIENFIGEESREIYADLEGGIVEQRIEVGSNGLVILPYFMGERTPIWDENATGVMFGLSLSHTKYHIFRAVLESVAYSLLHIMEAMSNEEEIKKIIIVGGGAKSELWRKIYADVTGLPVYTPKNSVEAPLGDAFLAAIGTNYISDVKTLEKWVEFDEPVYPDMNNHKKYKLFYKIYKDLYQNLKSTMTERSNILKSIHDINS